MGTRSNGAHELFGRGRELAAIDSLLASGASSSRTLILLGDVGMGKTALLGAGSTATTSRAWPDWRTVGARARLDSAAPGSAGASACC